MCGLHELEQLSVGAMRYIRRTQLLSETTENFCMQLAACAKVHPVLTEGTRLVAAIQGAYRLSEAPFPVAMWLLCGSIAGHRILCT